jgi:indolepyruvate ferredoxin oxidoreductase, beta subunit
MTCDIVLCGVGGQGVLSIAAIIAGAAMAEGLRVRQSEVHGMAQRGGAVSAHLRISDRPISGDIIPSGGADLILSMEPVESLRYLSFLKPEGAIVTAAEPFINIPDYPELAPIIEAIESLPRSRVVAAAELAKKAGSARAVNMVMVGAASPFIPVSPAMLEQRIAELFGAKDASLVEGNLRAFAAGAALSAKSALGRGETEPANPDAGAAGR